MRVTTKSDPAPSGPRAIDVPIESLPPIDEHSIEIDASAEAVWEALVPTLQEAFGNPRTGRFARLLGCVETEIQGDLTHPGGTLPGFVVARSVPPALLALLGRHRFSRYALVFGVDRRRSAPTRLRAATRAEFPGAKGRAYRALVIGSRAHVLVVRRLLRAVEKRVEREAENAA